MLNNTHQNLSIKCISRLFTDSIDFSPDVVSIAEKVCDDCGVSDFELGGHFRGTDKAFEAQIPMHSLFIEKIKSLNERIDWWARIV